MNRQYFLVLCLSLTGFIEVHAATVTWDGGIGGTGTSWNDPVNWSGDVLPSSDDDVVIDVGGDVTIIVHGSQTVNSLENHEVLWLQGGGLGGHAKLTLKNDSLNAGQIVLSSIGTYTATLAVTGGTLTNTATGVIEAREGNSATSYLDGSFQNLGSVVVRANAVLSSTGTFRQAGGSMGGAGTFHQTGGLLEFTGGEVPVQDHVYVSGGTLLVGAGVTTTSTIRTASGTSHFLGNASPAVTVSIEGGVLNHAVLTVTDGAVNAGHLVLSSIGTYTATLAVTAGTLTNTATGVIESRDGNKATSYLDGSFLNLGSVVVQANAVLSSTGTFRQAGGSMGGAGTFHQTGGLLEFTGGEVHDRVYVSGGTLLVGAGVTTTSIIRTASGTSHFLGNASPAVTVSIEGGVLNHAVLTVTDGAVNAGHLVLSSIGTYTATLAVTAGTLTNTATGVIEAREGNSATSYLDGSFQNLGAIVVQANAELVSTTGTFRQAGGSMGGAGRFRQNSGLFEFTGGQVQDNIYVSGGALLVGGGVTTPSIVRTATPTSHFLGNASPAVTVSIEGGVLNHAVLTVTDGAVNAGHLVLSSIGTYTATLAVTAGTLTNTATGVIEAREGNSATSYLDGSFQNLGAIVVQANAELVSTTGTFRQAGGSMGGAGRFRQNSGLFEFTGGQVQDNIYISGGALLVGGGVTTPSIVRTATPTSHFLGNASPAVTVSIEGGVLNHAVLTVTDGAVNAGHLVLSSIGTYTATLAVTGGTLTNTATGVIESHDGNKATSYLDGSFLNLGSVVVQANAVLSSTGTFRQAGGSMGGAGTFHQTGGLLEFTGGEVHDRVYVSGGTLLVGAGVTTTSIIRTASGTSHFLGNASPAVTVSIEGGVLNHAVLTVTDGAVNAGHLVLSSIGTYTATLAVTAGTLTNTATGVIEAREGNSATSYLDGSFQNLGAIVVQANAELVSTTGTFRQAGGSMGGAGRFRQNSGLFEFTGGQVQDNIYVSGGALLVGGGVTTPSIVRTATPTSHFLGNASPAVTVSIEGGVLNHAVLTVTDGAVNAGHLVLSSIGTYTATLAVTAGTLTNTATGVIEAREGNSATSYLDGSFQNLGALVVQANATLYLNGGPFLNDVSGRISGSGTINAPAVSLTNAGTVSPGASPGILSFIGIYNQTASGKLEIDIGGASAGTEYDRFAVNGTANLDGQLKVFLINGYVPPLASVFTILTATTRNGTFDTVSGPPSTFDPIYQSGSVDLKTVGIAPTPPTITLQPVSHTVHEGEAVSFTVAANGATPLSYQWRFNGVDIDNDNAKGATFAIASVSSADAGRYSVRVSNSSGYDNSHEAVLALYPGIERAYSVGQHGSEGRINIPLNLAGQPTSDPRLSVKEILVVFGIPVQPTEGFLTPAQVIVTSSPSTSVPSYTVSFAEGGGVGKELTILFSQPLPDQHRYRISFESFVDADGNPLSGDTDLEFRVLQGDANNNGAVTATDVSFVRGHINETAAFGTTARADVNMSGSITGPDVSFVRARIGHSAP